MFFERRRSGVSVFMFRRSNSRGKSLAEDKEPGPRIAYNIKESSSLNSFSDLLRNSSISIPTVFETICESLVVFMLL